MANKPLNLNLNTDQLLRKVCAYVMGEARKNCPVDTGELRNSITYEVVGDTGIVGSPLEYAPYVEYGTGLYAEGGNGRGQDNPDDVPWHYQDAEGNWFTTYGQQPQPYLRPALSEHIDDITNLILKEVIKDV